MAKNSTRKITTSPKPVAAAKRAVATEASKARAAVAKPDTAAEPVTAANVPAPAVAKPAAGLNRTARTIVANATNFGGLSDRDTAYLSFYAGFAKRGNGTVTLADIVASGNRPAYTGSNKPHDAGVVNRLGKAGLLNASADGHSFTFTPAALTHSAYVAG